MGEKLKRLLDPVLQLAHSICEPSGSLGRHMSGEQLLTQFPPGSFRLGLVA